MKKMTVALFVLPFVLALVQAASPTNQPTTTQSASAPSTQPKVRVVTNNDRVVVVQVGTVVSVRLEGTEAKIGWETGTVRGVLEPTGPTFEPKKDAEDASIGTYIFDFKTVQTGRMALRFDYNFLGDPQVKQQRRIVRMGTFTVTIEVVAATATQPVDEKAVAELIRQLGDNDFKVREAATEKLAQMGTAIHLLLDKKQQEKNLDPEIARRIRAVLSKTNEGSGTVVTDEGTGITVSLEDGGKAITASRAGQTIWKTTFGREVGTSLKVKDGTVTLLPDGMTIELTTGRLLGKAGGG